MISRQQFLVETCLYYVLIFTLFSFAGVHDWSAMSACAVLMLLAVIYPSILVKSENLPRFFVAGMLSVFMGILIQWGLLSLSPFATGVEAIKWFACVVLFFSVQCLRMRALRRLLGLIVLIGLIQVLYGAWEVVSGQERILWLTKQRYQGFVTGTYLNHNHLAGFLEITIGIQFGFILERTRNHKYFAALVAGFVMFILLIGLVYTNSRMGLFSLIASFAVFYIFLSGSKNLTLSKFLVLIVFFAMSTAIWINEDAFISRMADLGSWEESGGGRLKAWRDTLSLIAQYPLIGTGLGTYEWIFPQFQSETLMLRWNHAHQDYLELASELGLIFTLILILSISRLFVFNIKKLVSLPSATSGLGLGLIVGLVSMAIHGFADFNFAIPGNQFVWFLVLGVVTKLSLANTQESEV